MIYIIADDLTGANDTGVQFSKQGYATHVAIVSEAGELHTPPPQETDVLVIDTETRETDAPTVRERITRILHGLHTTDDDILYKKIDSTLRGNVGVELDECIKIFHKDLCILTPSFPSNRRITVEGYVIVHDQPLGFSEYYNGELEPEAASFLPALLQPHTDFPIARIDLQDVLQGRRAITNKLNELYKNGTKIVVVDAINEEQLYTILKSSFDFHGSVLYSGSAGLANALSRVYNGKHEPIRTQREPRPALLIVNGSRRSVNQRQIGYLKTKMSIIDIAFDVEQLFTDRAACLMQCVTAVSQALTSGYPVVLHPEPRYLDIHMYQQVLGKYHQELRELEVAIRTFLGELIAPLLESHQINALILTGGDTAIGICTALQMYALTIIDELLPGIPLALGHLQDQTPIKIVTKAGGFGDERTLHVVLGKLGIGDTAQGS